MEDHDVKHMLVNPYYAINISSDLTGEHEPIIAPEQWIAANLRLIDEIGPQEWLGHLLATLQGAGPCNPDEIVGNSARSEEE